MGAVKNRIQVDIGFGDKLIKPPKEIELPYLLPEENISMLSAYHIESSLAEKFEAIVKLGDGNSRMKDFYDLYFIASGFSIRRIDLKNSINLTFNQRNTNLQDANYIFSEEFYNNQEIQRKWKIFISGRYLSANIHFREVLKQIEAFLKPCLTEENFDAVWNPEAGLWESEKS